MENNQLIKENKESSLKEKNIGMAILAYIIFFIPLLTDAKKDPFVKYHVKQGLVLFICGIVVWIVGSVLPWELLIVIKLLNLFLIVLMVIGIINASKGEQKPLPVVGKFSDQFKF